MFESQEKPQFRRPFPVNESAATLTCHYFYRVPERRSRVHIADEQAILDAQQPILSQELAKRAEQYSEFSQKLFAADDFLHGAVFGYRALRQEASKNGSSLLCVKSVPCSLLEKGVITDARVENTVAFQAFLHDEQTLGKKILDYYTTLPQRERNSRLAGLLETYAAIKEAYFTSYQPRRLSQLHRQS